MKYKTTTKAIKNGCANIVSVGYCELCHLLRNHEPNVYTAGVYGWNYDVYNLDGVTICTGYRGMPGRTAKNTSLYENAARAIWDDYTIPYEARAKKVEKLLQRFIAQC